MPVLSEIVDISYELERFIQDAIEKVPPANEGQTSLIDSLNIDASMQVLVTGSLEGSDVSVSYQVLSAYYYIDSSHPEAINYHIETGDYAAKTFIADPEKYSNEVQDKMSEFSDYAAY